MEKLQYGNWIRKKVLWMLGLISLALGILAVLPVPAVVRIASGLMSAATLVSFLYPLFSYYFFSPKGGNLQKKFYDLILDHLENHDPGKMLDIGTGNGILVIIAALRYRDTEITGVDFWGKDWEYSKSVCERNAQIARVADRVHYQKEDAASLNFPDAGFDAVVSNLVFHEVKMVKRKSDVLREALRVLKPGGSFAFIDYFYDSRYYGESSEFEILLRGLKLQKAELKPLHEVLAFSKLLRHPRALGRVGIVYGKK
jgi:ubiquinone/menaquinone biosynthesis C-methylase UbiE